MGKKAFDSIMAGAKQALAHARGEHVPRTRVNKIKRMEIDVAAIRAKLEMTQPQFASTFGFTLGTVRNWEQKRKPPQGPARTLLAVIKKNPLVVRNALAELRQKTAA